MVIPHRFIGCKSDSSFRRLEDWNIPLTAGVNGFRTSVTASGPWAITGVTAHRPAGHGPWVLGTASVPSSRCSGPGCSNFSSSRCRSIREAIRGYMSLLANVVATSGFSIVMTIRWITSALTNICM